MVILDRTDVAQNGRGPALQDMTDRTGNRPARRGRHGDGVGGAISSLLTGAGTLYLVTGSGLVTALVTALAVVLAGILMFGYGRSR